MFIYFFHMDLLIWMEKNGSPWWNDRLWFMDMAYGWITDFEHIAASSTRRRSLISPTRGRKMMRTRCQLCRGFPKNGWYGDVHKWVYRGVPQKWLAYNGKSMKIWMILGETLWIPCGSSGWMWMVSRKKTIPLFKKGTQLPTMDPNLKVATDSTSCNFKARPLESPKDRFPSDIPSISDLLLVDILRWLLSCRSFSWWKVPWYESEWPSHEAAVFWIGSVLVAVFSGRW